MNSSSVLSQKSTLLFIVLGGFFVANAIIAEFIGVKIFSLEETLGYDPVNMTFFGQDGYSFNLTAGMLLWPVVFIMTDVINEYFGKRGVRVLTFLAVILISYAFVMVYGAISLSPDLGWWQYSKVEKGVPEMQAAFQAIFGQGMWIIVGSLVAFLIGQMVDVLVFHRIKKWTGEGKVWLRATGSTLVSQFLDSYVVLYIAFVIGSNMPIGQFLALGTVGYIYKFGIAILLTPLIYLAHYLIDQYLGEELAAKLKREAAQ